MTRKMLFHPIYKFKIFAVTFLTCYVVCCFAVAAGPQITWDGDFEQATMQAKMSNRFLFIHFYGDNCPPCKLMETNVFTNPQVIAQMNRDFVALKINVADQPMLAKRFSIKAIPTDVVLSSDGQLIHRRQGGISTDRFVEYLVYLLNTVQKEAVSQTAPPNLNQDISQQHLEAVAAPMVSQNRLQIPPTPSVGGQSMEPLRDPFTKQPVASPANSTVQTQQIPGPVPATLTPQERFNPVREEKPTHPEFTAVPATAPPVVSQLSLREAIVAPPSFPVGHSSNSDEAATTMVEVPLGLEGYCPVMLSTAERWIPGNPAYYTMYRGHVFRFSSEEAMTEFMKEPSKYAPVAMGEDIVQMVDRNKKIYGNRKFGAWFQGRVFLFCNQESLDTFGSRPEYYAEIALKYETAFKGTLGRF